MIRAKCKINNLHRISQAEVRRRLSESIKMDGDIDPLEVGAVYDVLAVEWREDGGAWIFIHCIPSIYFPSPYPVEFFEFLEFEIPDGWVARWETRPFGLVMRSLSFAEWANDEYFYERLVDGGEVELERYNRERFRELG